MERQKTAFELSFAARPNNVDILELYRTWLNQYIASRKSLDSFQT
jgi:hypothetical protein